MWERPRYFVYLQNSFSATLNFRDCPFLNQIMYVCPTCNCFVPFNVAGDSVAARTWCRVQRVGAGAHQNVAVHWGTRKRSLCHRGGIKPNVEEHCGSAHVTFCSPRGHCLSSKTHKRFSPAAFPVQRSIGLPTDASGGATRVPRIRFS